MKETKRKSSKKIDYRGCLLAILDTLENYLHLKFLKDDKLM
jgi:hypothetical protein